MSDRVVLGVDGGGSKTIAWIARVNDESVNATRLSPSNLVIVGRGAAGPSNPRSVGFDLAYRNIKIAISLARTSAGLTPIPFAAACLSLAGVGRDSEKEQVRQWAHEQQLAQRTMIMDDIEPLCLAAKYEHPSADWHSSITLVAGTGSIASGRNQHHSSLRLGGWGYLLGDEGSGFSIGLAALQCVCRQFDDGTSLNAFHKSLLHELEIRDPRELIGFMYQNPPPREQVAGLSRIVIENCSTDAQAKLIVEHAISAMADLIHRLAKRLELASRGYALALSGGILSGNPWLVESLLNALHSYECEPQLHHIIAEPIFGPLLMAKEAL
jgi:N-acetylglucosamine kinase-like BadF-type ATPase